MIQQTSMNHFRIGKLHQQHFACGIYYTFNSTEELQLERL